MNRYRFIIGRTPEDPEKCILPTIMFINTNHSAFKEVKTQGFMVVFGWWDYSIKIGMLF